MHLSGGPLKILLTYLNGNLSLRKELRILDCDGAITHLNHSKVLILNSSHHSKNNLLHDSRPFLLLGHSIHAKVARWGAVFSSKGEFSYTEGYWEWLEDLLVRNRDALIKASIYDAVFASLFTYDCNPNVIRAFCESWCPTTNTLHTLSGENSISLWDLQVMGALPISGTFYDEVVPNAKELSSMDNRSKPYLPPSCKYLFLAFHTLREKVNSQYMVSVTKWINHWFRGPLKYQKPPARNPKRVKPPKCSYNPSGFMDLVRGWSPDEEIFFTNMGIEDNLKQEVHLAAFLSCWLYIFVFPGRKGSYIRPETFKIASRMA